MSSSTLTSGSSMGSDEYTPNNSQDLQCADEQYVRKGCAHEFVDNATVPMEEQETEKSLNEESFGEDSMLDKLMVYKGDEFHRASNFQDSECGEPVKNQHLRLDFSPIQGVDDNEYTVKKCIEFWDFFERNPNIKKFQAQPYNTNQTYDKEPYPHPTEQIIESGEPNAINWLKHEELMSKAFVTKPDMRYCESGSGDNCYNWKTQKSVKTKRMGMSTAAPRRSLSRRRNSDPSGFKLTEAPQSSEEVSMLCKELEVWDLSHPKSMEPPGHPPNLCYTYMHRENLK